MKTTQIKAILHILHMFDEDIFIFALSLGREWSSSGDIGEGISFNEGFEDQLRKCFIQFNLIELFATNRIKLSY